jgi:hypothetical protein
MEPGARQVACEPLHATLPLRDCIRRHVGTVASGAARGSPLFVYCHACPVGAKRLERASWFTPLRPTMPAVVLGNVQRVAFERWRLSFPAHRERQDRRLEPFAEAALATPDDAGAVCYTP